MRLAPPGAWGAGRGVAAGYPVAVPRIAGRAPSAGGSPPRNRPCGGCPARSYRGSFVPEPFRSYQILIVPGLGRFGVVRVSVRVSVRLRSPSRTAGCGVTPSIGGRPGPRSCLSPGPSIGPSICPAASVPCPGQSARPGCVSPRFRGPLPAAGGCAARGPVRRCRRAVRRPAPSGGGSGPRRR